MDFATMVMELLSKDLLFFQKRDITWDGAHHGLECVRVNDAKYDYSRVPLFADLPGGGECDTYFDELKEYAEKNGFDDVWELVAYFQIALLEIEQDDELVVPRSMVSPDLSGGLPEGDLTAISLVNLAGCRGMLEVSEGGELYSVICGERLALGIPRFYDLIARLLWDLRQFDKSQQGKPFTIMCTDDGQSGGIEPMKGAQECPAMMTVEHAPEINLAPAARTEKKSATAKTTAKEPASVVDRAGKIKASEETVATGGLTQASSVAVAVKAGTDKRGSRKGNSSANQGYSIINANEVQSLAENLMRERLEKIERLCKEKTEPFDRREREMFAELQQCLTEEDRVQREVEFERDDMFCSRPARAVPAIFKYFAKKKELAPLREKSEKKRNEWSAYKSARWQNELYEEACRLATQASFAKDELEKKSLKRSVENYFDDMLHLGRVELIREHSKPKRYKTVDGKNLTPKGIASAIVGRYLLDFETRMGEISKKAEEKGAYEVDLSLDMGYELNSFSCSPLLPDDCSQAVPASH